MERRVLRAAGRLRRGGGGRDESGGRAFVRLRSTDGTHVPCQAGSQAAKWGLGLSVLACSSRGLGTAGSQPALTAQAVLSLPGARLSPQGDAALSCPRSGPSPVLTL